MSMLAFWRGYIDIKWIYWNAECIHQFIYKMCTHNVYIYIYTYIYGFALYIYIYIISVSILYLSLVGGSVHVFFSFLTIDMR